MSQSECSKRVLFATAAPGLEDGLLGEVQALPSVGDAVTVPGGVEFAPRSAEPEALYSLIAQANLRLRSCGRVLLRVGQFSARSLQQIVEGTKGLPWDRYLLPDLPLVPRVTCHKSRIYHTGAAAERVLLGISQRLKGPVLQGKGAKEDDGLLLLVRAVHDEWELSLDTSGELLHQRGYRREAGDAPLRETLASGLLLLCGKNHLTPLGPPIVDLFCGSGTLAIEAALLRKGIAPGRFRSFAFARFRTWQRLLPLLHEEQVKADAAIADRTDSPLSIGIDIDGSVLTKARDNARRAGVEKEVHFVKGDCFALLEGGALGPGSFPLALANPPYGKRLGGNLSQVQLHKRLRRLVERHFGEAVILCGSREGAGLYPEQGKAGYLGLRLQNGGFPVTAIHYRAEPAATPSPGYPASPAPCHRP